MCGLCGLIGEDSHWSDPIDSSIPGRRERLRRIASINQIVAPFRLQVSDVQGASYLVQGPTGKQAIASGLEQLWKVAEDIVSRKLDPLDPRILEHLEAGS